MSVARLIKRIAGRQTERQTQKVQSYRDLVKAMVCGNEPDPNEHHCKTLAKNKSYQIDRVTNDVTWAARAVDIAAQRGRRHTAEDPGQ